MRKQSRLILVPLSLLLLVAVACSDGATGADADVTVTLADTTIATSPATFVPGMITFSATNDGSTIHEFEIFSVPAGVDTSALTVSSNVADIDAAKLVAVDEVEDIAPGTTKELTATLKAGRYTFICNLPGHYAAGMVADFNVS